MLNPKPPAIASVDVIATAPTAGDLAVARRLSEAGDSTAPAADGAVFIVRIKLESIPTASSSGWALYVADERVPKYWGYPEGIYFKVTDPDFFARHAGDELRFSADGQTFIATGKRLDVSDSSPATAALSKGRRSTKKAAQSASVPTKLPTQAEVLKKQ